jgi:hypothetical protein
MIFFSNALSSFQYLSKWVTSTVDMENESKAEIKSLPLFLELVSELIQIGNFNSALSVLSGIKKSLVFQNKPQKDFVKQIAKYEADLKKHFAFMNRKDDNHKQCVPCIQYYLKKIKEIQQNQV